nr:actin cytoskeleton-regulatory complex protein PAN1-like [Penaeus vannamei]
MSKGKESKMDSRVLEKKLSSVRETSEDIQSLSRWCLQHRNHHHSIIQAWSRAVRKSKVPHRLTLFYVCNDIVQNARRKKILDIVQHFATAIKESAPLVRDEKIRHKIVRIFNIWEERGIYDAKFIAELSEIIENVGTVNATENEIVLSSFQPVQLVEGIRSVVALEKTTESLLTDLKNQDFSLTDEEINQLRQTVKERGTSRERMEEFEEAVIALECYMASVQKEIEERTQVVTLLEQAEIFYETQRGEAKLVANAYKNFGNRVKTLKTKLQEKMKTLPEPSPVPSPTVDAPSPENSDDENLSLPDSASSAMDSFLNSSKFAELAKGALSGVTGDLEARISALRKEEKMEKSQSKSSSNMEVKEVQVIKDGNQSSDSIEIWEVANSKESHGTWDGKESSRDTDERREVLDVHEVHESWDRESAQRRDYAREHRSSRSSRDSRDSRDGEVRDSYRSSSWDHGGSDREYSHKPRDREYSHTPASSYDSPIQPPKDLKPMSAAELLDTFGKAYLSKSGGGGGSGSSNATSPVTPAYDTAKAPSTPTSQSAIPDLTRPPPSLSIPLPPNNPPPSDSPSPYVPGPFSNSRPFTPKSHYPQGYPLPPETPPKPFTPTPTGDQPPPYPPYETPPVWVPPPPPPPPPPEMDSMGGPGGDYEMNRNYSGGWSDYDQYANSGDLNEDDADDRNWGEPPGNEELEALHSDTPSSPPPYEKGYSGALHPPPLPPAFCGPARSNLRELVSEGEDSDHRTNLVSIKPRGADMDYRCYDYSSLSDPTGESSVAPIPSIQSLFAPGDDQDFRVKKSGLKQNNADSGSDMDISASDSENDMDISDESGKEGANSRKEGEVKEQKLTKESGKSSSSKKTSSENEVKKDRSTINVSGDKAKPVVNSAKSEAVGVNTITSVLDSASPVKSEEEKVSEDECTKSKDVKPLPVTKRESEGGSNGSVSEDKECDSDMGGRDWYGEFCQDEADDEPQGEEYIPTVIAKSGGRDSKERPKSGGRGNGDRDYSVSRNYGENNVIDVMKSLDQEFNQQRDRGKGNFEGSNHSRGGHYGGNYRGSGFNSYQSRGEFYGSPHNQRGRGRGGPTFHSPRGRGRGFNSQPGGHHGDFHRGTPPYSPSARGYHGSDSYGGGRGGRRGGRGGRQWW